MLFTHDIEDSLREAVDLVNTLPEHSPSGDDELVESSQLEGLLERFPTTANRSDRDRELTRVRAIRHRVAQLWSGADDVETAEHVNEMLRRGRALPQLSRHGEYGWHIHAADPDAPVWVSLEVEIAMAFVELLRIDALDRAKHCAADDCDAVLIDLSRNRSKQYCDTGNCGNRANVRAYRARQAADGGPSQAEATTLDA